MQDQYARAKNAGLKNAVPMCRVEAAGLENAGNDIVWITMYYLCLLNPATYKVQLTPYTVC